jgi:RND family efflux transporter MFP subunit
MRAPMCTLLRLRLSLAVLFGAVAACGDVDAGKPVRTPSPPRNVTLVVATTTELPRAVQVNGALQAQDELVLGFQVAGRLDKLQVDLGDQVQAGELLAALDRRDFELDIARVQAALDQARAQLGLTADGDSVDTLDIDTTAAVREAQAVLQDATLQRDRVQELVQQKLRPPSDLDAADAAFAVASSRLQRARDQVRTWIAELKVRQQELEVSRKRLQDAEICAPWPGHVAARQAAVGQYLAIGGPVLTLLRTNPLRLRLEVPERAAAEVRPGQRVDFSVDGVVGESHGKVARLGSAIDRVNRTLLVEAEVENADGKLLPGCFCRASIVVAAAESVVVVPIAAMVSFAGVDRVFCVVDGKAVERQVTPGRRLGDRVEICAGLTAGTEVVAEPGNLVQGAAVRVGGR